MKLRLPAVISYELSSFSIDNILRRLCNVLKLFLLVWCFRPHSLNCVYIYYLNIYYFVSIFIIYYLNIKDPVCDKETWMCYASMTITVVQLFSVAWLVATDCLLCLSLISMYNVERAVRQSLSINTSVRPVAQRPCRSGYLSGTIASDGDRLQPITHPLRQSVIVGGRV